MVFWPPGLLSITTVWPHALPRRSPRMRATLSGPEPGGCDNTQRTGLSGHACACARVSGSVAPASAACTKWRRCIEGLLVVIGKRSLQRAAPLAEQRVELGVARRGAEHVVVGSQQRGVTAMALHPGRDHALGLAHVGVERDARQAVGLRWAQRAVEHLLAQRAVEHQAPTVP